MLNAVENQPCLCDVRSYDDLPDPWWRPIKHLPLVDSRHHGMKWNDDELICNYTERIQKIK